MDEELKPCPFCGSERVTAECIEYVTCRKCGADGPYFTDADTEKAIAAWNKRA